MEARVSQVDQFLLEALENPRHRLTGAHCPLLFSLSISFSFFRILALLIAGWEGISPFRVRTLCRVLMDWRRVLSFLGRFICLDWVECLDVMRF